jgi:hypothetical protein
MSKSGFFLDHTGFVDHELIRKILDELKNSVEYQALDKITCKRLYGILVECLENISKHSVRNSSIDPKFKPFISAREYNNKIIINSGNPVRGEIIVKLSNKLDNINNSDCQAMNSLYDDQINKEIRKEDKGAGLGFIMMKLKSGNKIDYSFKKIDNNYSFFEIGISLNKFNMRKLVFEKSDSSPKVILDPDKNYFEISGESRPADVGTFYGEILRWMDDYSLYILKMDDIPEPIIFNFDLEYFNSSSAKYILDFCKQIASVRTKGVNIEVKWKYEKDDTDMLEAGQEMSRISKLPFEYVSKEI